MDLKSLYQEILNEHNLRPSHKGVIENATFTLQGVNPSCGDDIVLQLRVEDDKIVDGAFVGDGCAVSQASADIMLGIIVGKRTEEALRLGELFSKMIKGQATQEEVQELEEASALQDISHMPARVKCAVLGWRTMAELLKIKD